MSYDLGIIFELQWKKKPGGNNREDVASIGIWDTPDSSLDWMSFKSYVCQNLGTTEDIYMAYVDSDGDELPIESECEFQEALKFARQRARKGREVVLKVDKLGYQLYAPNSSEPKQKGIPESVIINSFRKDVKKKHSKTDGKIISKTKYGEKHHANPSHLSLKNEGLSGMEAKKKREDHSISHEISKKLACIMKLETEKHKKTKSDKDDSPPVWFKKYMQKFKSEIVAEVTTNVIYNTRQILENAKVSGHPSCSCCCERNAGSGTATKAKKKKTSDDDSSDCALSSDQRDHKLLKKIEKLHKREKKLEKKLDSKLEKLENKTKRRMEKKFQNKCNFEQVVEKKACLGSRKRLSDIPVGTYLMDAIPLNGLRSTEIHIRLGENFTKIWEVMNNGALPWTDKTELRLEWGTSGLEPEATVLKCPVLAPGEKGEIAVTFRAPEFPGIFESYWHFYHMGDRFGRWLGCAVIVDSKESEKQTNDATDSSSTEKEVIESAVREENKAKADQSVDLTTICEPDEVVSSSVPQCEDTYESINQEQLCEDKGKTESGERNIEYESDSDDENLSVISGTISITSDSEEDENFVVVPMPACFMCDVPLEKADNVPACEKRMNNDVEEDKTPVSIKEMPTSNEQNDINMNTSYKTCDEPTSTSEVESEKQASSTHEGTPIHIFEGPEYTTSDVYVVDPEGCCLPANVVWANHNTNKNNKKDDASEESQNESQSSIKCEEKEKKSEQSNNTSFHNFYTKFDSESREKERKASDQQNGTSFHTFYTHFDSLPKQGEKDKRKSEQSSGPTFHKTSFTHLHCNTARPSYMSFSSQPNGKVHTFNCQTNSGPNETQHSSESSSPNQSQDSRGASVHILPETLVTGAINVANQAFITARNVLSNLRARPSEEFGEWQWNDNAANWSTQTDRSTSESLKILLEMGFTNRILNVLLLQRYDNDITKVVAELLTYKDNPGSTHSRQTQ